jgi:hypothetical protein
LREVASSQCRCDKVASARRIWSWRLR